MLDGLMSRWMRPAVCALRRASQTCRSKYTARARRQGAVPLDQLREAQALEVFHDIIVHSIFGPAVVVDLDRVGVRKGRSQPDLSLEPLKSLRAGFDARPDQLHGAGALQKLVLSQVDFPHPPSAELPSKAILAELLGLHDLPSKP